MMGSDEPIEKKESFEKATRYNFKLKILLLMVSSNFATLLFFNAFNSRDCASKNDSQIIESLRNELDSSRSQIRYLVSSLNRAVARDPEPAAAAAGGSFEFDDLIADLIDEAKRSLGFHELPLGPRDIMGGDKIMFSYGAGCVNPNAKDELQKYMSYEVGGDCPVDEVNSQKLMLIGCEPLPRRRCHPKTPKDYADPSPLPGSLWATPADTSIVWDSYTCKNYSCLVDREHRPGSYDCKDCFNLQGRESIRWVKDDKGLSFGMDSVLATRPPGTIRIGLDIGGGSGTFAARMRERNVTIVTTSMNFDGPFNSFIAARGLLSMHVTLSQRFPFFENTMDIVHSMHVLSNWIPDAMLEMILYDVYRILRPGGLFWLDHFFCSGNQLNATYGNMFERVGFGRLRWNAGRKLDKGIERNEWYLSALFEKPLA